MRPKLFTRFEDVEKEIAQNAPQVVYKYRNWHDPFHKSLLNEGKVWFAHPFDLNDEEDIRPEIVFDKSELYRPEYFEKMVATAGMVTEEENFALATEQLALLKKNPSILNENAKNWNNERSHFDQIGVFSTASDPLSDHLWNEYGNQHAGFSLGFKTLQLCREMKCGFGFMHYSDDPILYSFLDKSDNDPHILYYKKNKWRPETEFRFVTVGVGRYVDRMQVCSVNSIADVTLGYQISKKHEAEIVAILRDRFSGHPTLYKTFKLDDGKLNRTIIRY
jgi:hypothetical protein